MKAQCVCAFLVFVNLLYICLSARGNATSTTEKESLLRISSGIEVNIELVPYVLRIVSGGNSICTGALIHVSWVLTAAHCIPNKSYPEDVEVFAGMDDTSRENESQKIVAKTVIIHKDYWEKHVAKYDVALIETVNNTDSITEVNLRITEGVRWILKYLKYIKIFWVETVMTSYFPNLSIATMLETCIKEPTGLPYCNVVCPIKFQLIKPVELSEKVSILELSAETWPQDRQMYERKCLAAGWGAEDYGRKAVKKLRALNVTARHGQKGCKCFRSFHNRRLVCLDERGRGICQGDSGGALVCDSKGVGVAHVIYSKEKCNPFALGNTKMNCRDTTGAYMYVCPLLDWINEYVPSVPKSPENCRASHSMGINLLLIFLSLLIHVPAIKRSVDSFL